MDGFGAVTLLRAGWEELGHKDVPRTRQMEAQDLPAVRLDGQPKPHGIASNLQPSLIHRDRSTLPTLKYEAKHPNR
jgi:hypothetical protein